MKKIKFDEATKKKAGEIWCQGSYDEMIDFLADVANRQLEALEKPVFEVGKTYLNGEGRKWKILSYCADEPGYDMAVLSDKGIKCSFMANGQGWKGGPTKYYDLLPGAIEELGQAGVSPPLVEEIDWKVRAEAAEKRAEKAEAALNPVRVRKAIQLFQDQYSYTHALADDGTTWIWNGKEWINAYPPLPQSVEVKEDVE